VPGGIGLAVRLVSAAGARSQAARRVIEDPSRVSGDPLRGETTMAKRLVPMCLLVAAMACGGPRDGDRSNPAAVAPTAPPATAPPAQATPRVDPSAIDRAGIVEPLRGFAGVEETGFRVAYARSENPTHARLAELLERERVFEEVAQALNAELVLPRTIDIQLVDCGTVNAFYDPRHGRIIVCYEIISYFAEMFRPVATSDEELGRAVIGATFFAFFHELGHALIHQLAIPAVGREEDAADQLATLVFLSAGDDGVDMALQGARWFALQSEKGHETPFWDEHAFDRQRFYNVLCLVFGSAPDKYGRLVDAGMLPAPRARRCPSEYRSIDAGWEKLMAPHLRQGGSAGATPAPPRPPDPQDDAPSCDAVAERVAALMASQLEIELAGVPEEEREDARREVGGRIATFVDGARRACAERAWPAEARRCIASATTVDEASRCPVPGE
jgi:hypothetical protein